jgi:hypothetical protein
MTEEKKNNNTEEKPIYKQTKGIVGIVIICCIGVLILAVLGGMLGGDNTSSSSDTADPFNGKGAKLENITISSSYGYFSVKGKIMFKNDETYAAIDADVNLKDGSKISESIVKNWNNVKKDQWYTFDGNLFSTSGNTYSMSDLESVDFKYNDEIIYTWKNS